MEIVDISAYLQDQVRAARVDGTPLAIRGGGSKRFYGRALEGVPLDVTGHAGIVSHDPTELVVTARCGTPLADLEAALADQGQMLPFEPPHFENGEWGMGNGKTLPQPTVGGMVAAGLSGPRRPWGGAVRDAVLGVKLLTGKGEILAFGGQVMKNVAGYDISRLMAGSLGSLGVILEVSMKVLPRPAKEITLVQEADGQEALARLAAWQGKAWPLSASLHDGERLWVRLSGTHAGVNAARDALGGEEVADNGLWTQVRDQALPFFLNGAPLWRLSVPPATPALDLPGTWLTEWGGAQRWLVSDAPAAHIRAAAASVGGHATLFRRHDGVGPVFQPLPVPLMALHKRLKASFDPAGMLNPGVMYADL
ncbi:MAG: glycolate oxidase subunit GlcE [Pseudomonadota bacterium]